MLILALFSDRGGTFTDIWASVPGQPDIVLKLLSVDPVNYKDAPIEGKHLCNSLVKDGFGINNFVGIRRVLSKYTGTEIPRGVPLPKSNIASIRMGTTVATNALLERKGTKHAFLVTKGLRDLLSIGTQSRPRLFDLDIVKPEMLFSSVVEIDERVTIEGFDEDVDCLFRTDTEIPGVLVRGISGDMIRILKPLDEEAVKTALRQLLDEGIDTVAVCLAHSYSFPDHEVRVGELALEAGFKHVSLSSAVAANMIRMVPRGSSASADAYLTPEIKRYLDGFVKGFEGGHLDDVRCEFMQSDGGLVSHTRFGGLKGILSGPAGGVVGYARTSFETHSKTPLVGFDMGGTSTDVSRFDGVFEHVFETTTAGVTIQSPQLDINTVAAGGGSILFWRNGLFAVGPESAGAHPGPASYRKGGPLTVTDANLFLGRLRPQFFPQIFGPNEDQPLDVELVRAKFLKLTEQINADTGRTMTPEEVAHGFLDVANEAMCRPIRALTEAKGYATGIHRLAVFGGAGGQHAGDIAAKLGISTVVIHKHSSILSAYGKLSFLAFSAKLIEFPGMALADVVQEAQEPTNEIYGEASLKSLRERISRLKASVAKNLAQQGVSAQDIVYECYLNMRYQGTETPVMVLEPEDGNFKAEFLRRHLREFTFVFPDGKTILVDDVRVRGTGKSGITAPDSESLGDELENLKCVDVGRDCAVRTVSSLIPYSYSALD
jgi:5-oxoprolinase (ATP-hydrolysing)